MTVFITSEDSVTISEQKLQHIVIGQMYMWTFNQEMCMARKIHEQTAKSGYPDEQTANSGYPERIAYWKWKCFHFIMCRFQYCQLPHDSFLHNLFTQPMRMDHCT